MLNLFFNCFEKTNNSDHLLPSEVLSHIFSFLKVNDRNNVRLTCSQWYDACNTIPICQTEKMYIRSNENRTILWFDILMNCPRLLFNIEFDQLEQFPPDATIFWQKCGPRVESLEFRKTSDFHQKEFATEMMKYCSNLKTFHLNQSEQIIHSNDFIHNWDELKITHQSLRFLNLEQSPFSDFHLSRLFDIFPRIQKLELNRMNVNCHKRIDARFYKPNTQQFYSDSIFSFSCIFANIKAKAENIKSLVFHQIGSSGLTDNWLEDLATLSELKLKEFKLEDHPLLTEKAFLKFFSNQIYLECVIIRKCQHFSSKCFVHMIRNCTNLETVEVECSDISHNFSTSQQVFHALMLLPCLKIFKLESSFYLEETVENVNQIAPISAAAFHSLRDIAVTMPAIYFDIFLPKLPTNLTALHLITKTGENGLTNVNLQLVFNKLIHLLSMSLSLDSTVSDYGFSGCQTNWQENQCDNSGISINRLKRLEKLMLVCNDRLNCITDISFSHFVFPNLRELKLNGFPKITRRAFKILCQNTPSMEYCELQGCEIEDKALSVFAEGWKKLGCFHIEIRNMYFWKNRNG